MGERVWREMEGKSIERDGRKRVWRWLGTKNVKEKSVGAKGVEGGGSKGCGGEPGTGCIG